MTWWLALFACAGGESTPTPSADVPTWHEHVAPIVREHCGSCHTAGGIAPFAVDDYASAAPMALAMSDAVDSGRMPPWGAQETEECEPRHGWKDDLRLSDEEKELLRDWAEGGAPEGDASDAAPLPEPPDTELDRVDLRVESVGWTVEDTGEDQFRCFSLDPGLDEETWLSGLQIDPGDDRVVHHVLVFLDPSGEGEGRVDETGSYSCFGGSGGGTDLIGAWAPGSVPTMTPDDLAIRLPAGTRLILQVHYHAVEGESVFDATALELRFAEGEPQMEAFYALIGNFEGDYGTFGLEPGPNDRDDDPEFRIPAGVADHTETMSYKWGRNDPDLPIWAMGTHMHYIGTDMKIWIERKETTEDEPAEECLIQTPAWDFNWQRGYAVDAEPQERSIVGPGDKLWMRCTYDNTLDNDGTRKALDDAGLSEPVDVYLGEETLDEMCLGVFGFGIPLD